MVKNKFRKIFSPYSGFSSVKTRKKMYTVRNKKKKTKLNERCF